MLRGEFGELWGELEGSGGLVGGSVKVLGVSGGFREGLGGSQGWFLGFPGMVWGSQGDQGVPGMVWGSQGCFWGSQGRFLGVPGGLTHLHADLPDGPGRVVAHGDELGVQVGAQDGHELGWGGTGELRWAQVSSGGVCDPSPARFGGIPAPTNAGLDVHEAGLGQVTQQGKGALAYLGHRVLGTGEHR